MRSVICQPLQRIRHNHIHTQRKHRAGHSQLAALQQHLATRQPATVPRRRPGPSRLSDSRQKHQRRKQHHGATEPNQFSHHKLLPVVENAEEGGIEPPRRSCDGHRLAGGPIPTLALFPTRPAPGTHLLRSAATRPAAKLIPHRQAAVAQLFIVIGVNQLDGDVAGVETAAQRNVGPAETGKMITFIITPRRRLHLKIRNRHRRIPRHQLAHQILPR